MGSEILISTPERVLDGDFSEDTILTITSEDLKWIDDSETLMAVRESLKAIAQMQRGGGRINNDEMRASFIFDPKSGRVKKICVSFKALPLDYSPFVHDVICELMKRAGWVTDIYPADPKPGEETYLVFSRGKKRIRKAHQETEQDEGPEAQDAPEKPEPAGK
ncbi:MAG: hypothetical protein WC471_03305 [Candidatus Woesearchaeota archaeon]